MEGEISGTARGSHRAGVPGRISGFGQNYFAVVLVQNITRMECKGEYQVLDKLYLAVVLIQDSKRVIQIGLD